MLLCLPIISVHVWFYLMLHLWVVNSMRAYLHFCPRWYYLITLQFQLPLALWLHAFVSSKENKKMHTKLNFFHCVHYAPYFCALSLILISLYHGFTNFVSSKLVQMMSRAAGSRIFRHRKNGKKLCTRIIMVGKVLLSDHAPCHRREFVKQINRTHQNYYHNPNPNIHKF